MPGAPEQNNGRVTLAVLGEKVDSLTERIDKIVDDHEKRLRDLEKCTTEMQTMQNVKFGISSALAVIGTALGIGLNPKP